MGLLDLFKKLKGGEDGEEAGFLKQLITGSLSGAAAGAGDYLQNQPQEGQQSYQMPTYVPVDSGQPRGRLEQDYRPHIDGRGVPSTMDEMTGAERMPYTFHEDSVLTTLPYRATDDDPHFLPTTVNPPTGGGVPPPFIGRDGKPMSPPPVVYPEDLVGGEMQTRERVVRNDGSTTPPTAIPPIDPRYASLDRARRKIEESDLLTPESYRKKKDKWYHNLGRGALNALRDFTASGGATAIMKGDLHPGALVGALLGGGVTNVASPYADEKRAIFEDKEKARKEYEDIAKVYDSELSRAKTQEEIESLKHARKIAEARAKIEGDKVSNQAAKDRATVEANEAKNILKSAMAGGIIDESEKAKYKAITGAVLPTFKKKVKDAEYLQDAKSGNVYLSVIYEDGTKETKWLEDETGKISVIPAYVQAALVNQQTSAARNVSNEKIASLRDSTARQLATLNMDEKAVQYIMSEVDQLMANDAGYMDETAYTEKWNRLAQKAINDYKATMEARRGTATPQK